MLDREIRERLGSLALNIENNYKIWLDCYHGEPFWLEDMRDADTSQSLNLCAAISSELARLTTMELETRVDDENLDIIYQKFIRHIRKFTEYGLALGGIVVKPYVEDYSKKLIDIDIVPANKFIILGFTSFGEINHIVFIDRIKKKDKKDKDIFFTRLEEHKIDDEYLITNTAYLSNNQEVLGDKISLGVVEEWADMAEEMIVDSDRPLFAYFKNPQANNLDLDSNEGISCFARALSLIQDADEQYQRIIWEYKGSELAIDADITALKNANELPAGKERLFRNLGLDMGDGGRDFYEVFSPDIRDSSLFNGLNEILKRIEFLCGLANGTLSDVEFTAKTATEIKTSQQRSHSTVKDIQNELAICLEDFIEILKYWYKELSIPYKEDCQVSFDFDDSLVVDSETEQKIRLQEVAAGILKPEAYLKWRYGVTDDELGDIQAGVEENRSDIAEEE
ncbi:phage portal protein [Anaerococcus marasmi]|uniref:phage portal protein n=1 Tax=Anaerococcus marasmi TaxID=2057797 RepID=UPI000CFA0015|nr:phage portal protein [Anaerococcus marasmi]